jgi:hypothetical protein
VKALIRLKYPLWSFMQDVLKGRPAFNPLDLFDSGNMTEDTDLDAIAKREFHESDDESITESKENQGNDAQQARQQGPDTSSTQQAAAGAVSMANSIGEQAPDKL